MEKLSSFVAHAERVNCLRLGPRTGRILVSGGEDRKINLWTIGKTSYILSLSGHTSPVTSVALDYPEELVVGGSSSGVLKLWDLEHAKVVRTLPGHKSAVSVVEFHPFGEFFASGSTDSSIKLWDIRRKGCLQTYVGHKGSVTCMQITPDGRWIATGGEDSNIKIWDMTAGKLLHTISEYTTPISCVTFNPEQFVLATSTLAGDVGVYDMQNFSCISSSPSRDPYTPFPSRISFRSDGGEMIVSREGSIDICAWDPLLNVKHHIPLKSSPTYLTDIRYVDGNGTSPKLVACGIDHQFIEIYGAEYPSKVQQSSDDHFPNEMPSLSSNSIAQLGKSSSSESLTKISASLSSLQLSSAEPSAPDRPTSSSAYRVEGLSLSSQSSVPSLPPITAKPEPQPARPSSAMTKSTFVPMCDGSRGLNLDLSQFLQERVPGHQPMMLSPTAGPIAPSTPDAELLDFLQFRHTSVLSILSNRLTHIRLLREAWNEHDLRPCMELLTNLSDTAVTVDFLRVINLKPRLVTLEIAARLLPLLTELLFEVFEDYIMIACQTIKLLTRQYSGVIFDSLQMGGTTNSVDISREERLERCHRCVEGFISAWSVLNDLGTTPGKVGSLIRQTVQDLEPFLQFQR